jgi:hypothetical protein
MDSSKSICPIHEIDYDKSAPLKTHNIKICKSCLKKLKKK